MSDYNPLRDWATTGADGVLRKAAATIRRRGWIQGCTCTGDGVDLLGAIAVASGMPIGQIDDRPNLLDAVPEGRLLAARAAWQILNDVLGDAIAWNDEPGRRASEVMDVLEWTADRLAFAR